MPAGARAPCTLQLCRADCCHACRRFKEDLGKYPPHFFVCVPLVLDTLYKRVQVCPWLCLVLRAGQCGGMLLSCLPVRRSRR